MRAVERADGGQISLEDTGLTAEEYARYEADLAEERRPPVEASDGMPAALVAARAAGLLVPVARGDQAPLHFVHRWTARAIAELHPDAVRQAHHQAAAFWHWRIDTLPQSREDDIDQLLEARYHHHAAGQIDQAFAATEEAVNQLQTWGQDGRAAGLCRETLTWLPPGSQQAAQFQGTLGILAQLRGNYDSAERSYRQVLEIFTRLGNQENTAAIYHQLGMLAYLRGDYDAAETLYRQSLDISERIGDQAGVATSYAVLGGLSQALGNLDQAVAYRVGALALRLQIGTVTAGDVRALTGLRRQLGPDRFRSAALASGLDEQSATSLMEMLNQAEEETAGN
jgi:tetratricopeptide (TPR) repeat protein